MFECVINFVVSKRFRRERVVNNLVGMALTPDHILTHLIGEWKMSRLVDEQGRWNPLVFSR